MVTTVALLERRRFLERARRRPSAFALTPPLVRLRPKRKYIYALGS